MRHTGRKRAALLGLGLGASLGAAGLYAQRRSHKANTDVLKADQNTIAADKTKKLSNLQALHAANTNKLKAAVDNSNARFRAAVANRTALASQLEQLKAIKASLERTLEATAAASQTQMMRVHMNRAAAQKQLADLQQAHDTVLHNKEKVENELRAALDNYETMRGLYETAAQNREAVQVDATKLRENKVALVKQLQAAQQQLNNRTPRNKASQPVGRLVAGAYVDRDDNKVPVFVWLEPPGRLVVREYPSGVELDSAVVSKRTGKLGDRLSVNKRPSGEPSGDLLWNYIVHWSVALGYKGLVTGNRELGRPGAQVTFTTVTNRELAQGPVFQRVGSFPPAP